MIASAAEAAATARGYNVASYTGILYVFNNVAGCGWSGLAYVGWARAYSNNTTNLLVIAPRARPQFRPAARGQPATAPAPIVVGGDVPSSEYGDPFNTMGNNRAMHFNAAQKGHAGLVAPGTVQDARGRHDDLHAVAIETAGAGLRGQEFPRATQIAPTGSNTGSRSAFDAFIVARYPNNGRADPHRISRSRRSVRQSTTPKSST